jgi:hypothetical protein
MALATIALVSMPFALDVYFLMSEKSDAVEEEYIPDGR